MSDFLPGARGPSSLITEGICPALNFFRTAINIQNWRGFRKKPMKGWKKTMAIHPSRNLRMQVWEEIQEPQLAMRHSNSAWWVLIWCRDLTAGNVSFKDGGFLSSLSSGRQDDERILSIRPLWQGQADCADSSFYTMGEKYIRKCPKHVLVKKGFVINICFWKMAYNSDFIVQHCWNENIFLCDSLSKLAVLFFFLFFLQQLLDS